MPISSLIDHIANHGSDGGVSIGAYTQALRDLPTTLKTWPAVKDADWPKKPAFMEKSSTLGV